MPDFSILAKQLNARQLEAVYHNASPLLVLAGAGSGKTRVITYKIANLLITGLARPHEILAITFTNKAAQEMSTRVQNTMQVDMRSLWIKTFHSAALWILRSHCQDLGYAREFTIYDEADRKHFVKDVIQRLGLDKEQYPAEAIINKMSLCKNTCLVPESAFPDSNELKIYQLYEDLKKQFNVLDFDDLLEKCVKLFKEKPEIREKYKRRWRYVMVDEYQDVNPLQYAFIRLITDRTSMITVVGDDDQSIYGWRGASPEHVFKFEHDFDNVKIVVLDQNYRSTGTIIAAASHLIAHNSHRKPKKLWTENESGDPIDLVTALNSFQEADAVLHRVEVMHKEGVNYKEMAVFYRTNYQSQVLENVLIKHRVPYQIIGGLKFFERAEIKDILAYLKVIINPHDDVNLKRVINTPQRGIGDTSIKKAADEAMSRGTSLHEVLRAPGKELFGKAFKDKLSGFFKMLDEFRKKKDIFNVAEMVKFVVEQTEYIAFLEKKPVMERENRIRNVDEFMQLLVQKTAETPDLTLEEYVEELSLYTAVDAMDDTNNKISLITLHNAKGLEFPVVFILGMEENLLPHKNSLEEDTVDEERRLFYVGVTRARKKLVLLKALERMTYGQHTSNQPSRFLMELPADAIHQINMVKSFEQELPSLHGGSDEAPGGFRKGDIVRHPQYGIGSIRNLYGEGDEAVVVVRFEAGEKKFIVKFSRLVKI